MSASPTEDSDGTLQGPCQALSENTRPGIRRAMMTSAGDSHCPTRCGLCCELPRRDCLQVRKVGCRLCHVGLTFLLLWRHHHQSDLQTSVF